MFTLVCKFSKACNQFFKLFFDGVSTINLNLLGSFPMTRIHIGDLNVDNNSFLESVSSTEELSLIHGGEIFTIVVIGVVLAAGALGATLGAHDRQRWGGWVK
jgi:hypothetical protein